MAHTNMGLSQLKRLGHERRRVLHALHVAQANEARKHWHTHSRAEREDTNAQIAEYLRRVPVPPHY